MLFPVSSKVSLIPANESPELAASSDIDNALKSRLLSQDVLGEKSIFVVPVELSNGKWFNLAFWIAEADFAQFKINSNTQISIASQAQLRPLPPHIQYSLARSWHFPQSHVFTSFPDLSLLKAFLTHSPSLMSFALYGQLGCGKRTLLARCIDELGLPSVVVDLEGQAQSADVGKLVDIVGEAVKKGARVVCFDGAELLKAAFKFHSLWHQLAHRKVRVVFIFHSKDMPATAKESFDAFQELKPPSRKIAAELFKELQLRSDCTTDLASDLTGFSLTIGEFEELASVRDISAFKARLRLRRRLQLASTEIPKVSWDQVAGLNTAKATLSALISRISHRPRPSAILLHGPPGTGKTLLAKALATNAAFSFLAVKGPELLSPYIGESEAALRDVFAKAKSQAPCIIFFDELDALVPKRGEFGDSVGVADRLVATLMLEMDAVSGLASVNKASEDSAAAAAAADDDDDDCVLVIGATNRPDLIDSSLMRSGRFDLNLYLGPPESVSERAAILEASCKTYRCSPDIDFEAVFADHREIKLSPAQIASIARIAAERALERKIASYQANGGDDLLMEPLSTASLKDALLEVVSVLPKVQ